MLPMLAELTTAIPDVGNVTATAILGWYAWHTASRTIPALVRAFRDEMTAMRAECRAQRESLLRELSAERLQRHTDHMAIIDALNALARRLPTLAPEAPSMTSSRERNTP